MQSVLWGPKISYLLSHKGLYWYLAIDQSGRRVRIRTDEE